MLLSNQNMPDLSRYASAAEKTRALYEYVYSMRQEINHVLSNLEEGNLGKNLQQRLAGYDEKMSAETRTVKAAQEEPVALKPLDAYPVGSIYLSASEISPGDLFGGEWEQLKDVFLLAAGDAYAAGSEGGETEHQLTESELPALNGTFRSFDVYNLNNEDAALHITGVFSYDESESYGTTTNMSSGKNDTVRKIHMNFGSDQPHNNMPPYLAVYAWKRTA